MSEGLKIQITPATPEMDITERQPSQLDPTAIVITVPDDLEPYQAQKEQDAIKAAKLRQYEEDRQALLKRVERTLQSADFIDVEELREECEPFGLWPEVRQLVLKAQMDHKIRQMFSSFDD